MWKWKLIQQLYDALDEGMSFGGVLLKIVEGVSKGMRMETDDTKG